jgi:putative endonuclease
MAEHNQTGKTGEEIAAAHLVRKGFKVLHKNFRVARNEVDIIAAMEQTLHFIEVKTKSGRGIGTPEQRVDRSKINRMKRVAEHYLYENPGWKLIQFDIISVTLQERLEPEIFVVEDVF